MDTRTYGGWSWLDPRQAVRMLSLSECDGGLDPNGFAIHHWPGILARAIDGSAIGRKRLQSIKCHALRVMILDELSMDSSELLGSLEYVVETAIRGKERITKRKTERRELLVV